MTHEQKPESAEFRTREELEALAAAYINRHYLPDCWHDVGDMVAEMMEAGAAEQRRKDEPEFEKIIAERDEAEDFIRKMAETVLGEAVEWSNVYGFQNALNDVSERIWFLEKDTANVAALEARVKELDGEICSIRKRVKDAASSVMGIRTDAMNGDNLAITLASYFEDLLGERDLNGWPPEAQKACDEIEAAIVAHMAAAIREGGEHG